jgi:formylglycine-generating enzyme required for sulfatase activity
VSWQDAADYARWLSEQTGHRYRLPTEAEWEYAARGGATTLYWWGSEPGSGHANCFNCGSEWDGKQTAPVGSFGANGFGLLDTAGNAEEWVEDCHHGNYDGAPGNGSAWSGGDCDRRMVRGGSYHSTGNNLRSSRRGAYAPEVRLDTLGFRLVREL